MRYADIMYLLAAENAAQDLSNQLSTLNYLYYILLIVGLLCIGVAVLLFFLFDIREIIAIMSGVQRKKTEKEMAELNANTGRLSRSAIAMGTKTPAKLTDNRKKDISKKLGRSDIQPNVEIQQVQTKTESEPAAETEMLHTDTTQLDKTGYTAEANTATFRWNKSESTGKFKIVYNLTEIHTGEIIPAVSEGVAYN